jgi:hypothetical protein
MPNSPADPLPIAFCDAEIPLMDVSDNRSKALINNVF